MAKIEFRDKGMQEFVSYVVRNAREDARLAVLAASVYMEKKIKEKLSGERTGKEYFVNKVRRRDDGTYSRKNARRRKRYTASAPGEPPAVKRGKLRQAVTHTAPKVTASEVVSFVGVDAKRIPYARRLEYGGASQTKQGGTVMIQPRPYMRPTFFEQEAEVVRIMTTRLAER